ncbi:unnamed protein product [Parnassius apollo]|uniref:(apollo) hypothetical protein n=1 Tax=Parnassius apollo TaxID=110799 RepID=A0A8S3WC42_PARAO|nr:unnamed protein product [Parnassius apollo]
MGLLDKLSVWLGGGRVEASVLVLGLDNSGKSSLLHALRSADQRPQHDADYFTMVAREELQLALAHPELRARRVPLLVLANKSDDPHALPAAHVAAALGLERISDKPWHVCATSAVSGGELAGGVAWLARQLRDAALQQRR